MMAESLSIEQVYSQMTRTATFLQGSLDLLILKSLMVGPLHGWAISKRIQSLSGDAFGVNQGSLYPALYRLEDRGLVTATEGEVNGRAIRTYRITAKGKRQLVADEGEWHAFALAMNRVMRSV
jgi:PadR family transcriptional regulator, regulatory protein PadR